MTCARLFPIVLAGFLAACTTMTPQEQWRADEETCRSYGFTRNNDAFAECLQRVELDRRAARRAALRHDPWFFAPPPRVIVVQPRR